jgi:Amt family ammonium transporter
MDAGHRLDRWRCLLLGRNRTQGLLKADDSLAVSGVIGSLLTGVFASKTIAGVEGNVLTQAIGIAAVLAYSLVMTALILWRTSRFFHLRVDQTAESDGLDIAQHAERVGA